MPDCVKVHNENYGKKINFDPFHDPKWLLIAEAFLQRDLAKPNPLDQEYDDALELFCTVARKRARNEETSRQGASFFTIFRHVGEISTFEQGNIRVPHQKALEKIHMAQ
jgi:hypothetical protein